MQLRGPLKGLQMCSFQRPLFVIVDSNVSSLGLIYCPKTFQTTIKIADLALGLQPPATKPGFHLSLLLYKK